MCLYSRTHERNLSLCVHSRKTDNDEDECESIRLRHRDDVIFEDLEVNSMAKRMLFSSRLSSCIQLSTVDHYGNEYSYFIITLRHEQ